MEQSTAFYDTAITEVGLYLVKVSVPLDRLSSSTELRKSL